MTQFDHAFRFSSQARSNRNAKGDEIRAWTCGFVMAIGWPVAIPDTAPAQPTDAEPMKPANISGAIGSPRTARDDRNARPCSRRPSSRWSKPSTRVTASSMSSQVSAGMVYARVS